MGWCWEEEICEGVLEGRWALRRKKKATDIERKRGKIRDWKTRMKQSTKLNWEGKKVKCRNEFKAIEKRTWKRKLVKEMKKER